MRVRAFLLAGALVAGLLAAAAPAAVAAEGDDRRVSMVKYQVVPYTGFQIGAYFTTPKVEFGDWSRVDVDLSTLADYVRVEPVGSCEPGIKQLRCWVGRTDDRPQPELGFSFNISATPSAPVGPAGHITVSIDGRGVDPNPGNNTAEVVIDIANTAGSTISVTTAPVTAARGETVTVPITGRNQGPNALYSFIVGDVDVGRHELASGLEFVGFSGCTDYSALCATGPVPVGASATIGVRLRATGCGTGRVLLPVGHRDGFSSREVYQSIQYPLHVTLAGCAGQAPPPGQPAAGGPGAAPGSGGAPGSGAVPGPSAAPSSSGEPTTAPDTVSPSPSASGEPPMATIEDAVTGAGGPPPWLWALVGLVVSGLAAAVVVFRGPLVRLIQRR